MFFFALFHIKWPCKDYNFQTCLRDNLVPRMLEMAFQSLQISKFSGGACPQTPPPPRLMGLMAPCSYSRLFFFNQLPTSNFIETPGQVALKIALTLGKSLFRPLLIRQVRMTSWLENLLVPEDWMALFQALVQYTFSV